MFYSATTSHCTEKFISPCSLSNPVLCQVIPLCFSLNISHDKVEGCQTHHVTLMEAESGSLGLLDSECSSPVEALKPFLRLVLVMMAYYTLQNLCSFVNSTQTDPLLRSVPLGLLLITQISFRIFHENAEFCEQHSFL